MAEKSEQRTTGQRPVRRDRPDSRSAVQPAQARDAAHDRRDAAHDRHAAHATRPPDRDTAPAAPDTSSRGPRTGPSTDRHGATAVATAPVGWRAAAEAALYGPGGFYRRSDGPAAHFRTSVHVSPLFATAVARLLCRLDEVLGRPDGLAFVDMGAGHGELVSGVLAALPPEVASRTRGYAVERAGRPPGTDPAVVWTDEPPQGVTGLLFANEWLDNVPLDVVEVDGTGVARGVLVGADGTETHGEPVHGTDAEWLARWWPLPPEPGRRAEIGLTRDTAWAAATKTLDRGLAVAVDYAHFRHARPLLGTLTGFRDGRETVPVPDGSCDITAHVALDACALPGARLLTQRAALRALGPAGRRPPLSLAATDPAGYVRALATAGEAAELTAQGGLGDFRWLLQPVGLPAGEALLVDIADDEEQ